MKGIPIFSQTHKKEAKANRQKKKKKKKSKMKEGRKEGRKGGEGLSTRANLNRTIPNKLQNDHND